MPPRCQLLFGSLSIPRTVFSIPQSTQRGFTSSTALYKNPLTQRRGGDLGKHHPKHIIPQEAEIPDYPYGHNLLFKQANKGLYGGQMIQFGNNVSKKTETTTRRYWKPNVLNKSLYSVALKKRIQLRVTARVLKIIDNEGGLDEYLLKPSEARIKELGPLGWQLRWTLLQKPHIIRRMRAEAAVLGLTQEQIDAQWPMPHPVVMTATAQADSKALAEMAANARTKQTPETIAKRNHRLERTKIANIAAVEYVQANNFAKKALKLTVIETREKALIVALLGQKSRPEKKANYKADLAEAGSEEDYLDMKRADYAQQIEDAKKAQSDSSLPEADRLFFQSVFEKAKRMNETSMLEYVEATVDAELEPLTEW